MTLHPQFWWWVSRATGMVAWAAAAASVAWGVAVSGRLVRRRRLPAWMLDLHRHLATLTIAFLAVHLLALVADSYVQFDLRDLVVPMASAWKPGPVAWGIVALYGLVVVQVTSWTMRWIPRRAWHGVHLLAYVVFVTATVHSVLAGTDRANPAFLIVMAVGCTLVATLTILRILARTPAAEAAASDDRAARIAAAKAAARERAAARTRSGDDPEAVATGAAPDPARPGILDG
jgi:sulfoxide reductase heme-binding subunit YedZ